MGEVPGMEFDLPHFAAVKDLFIAEGHLDKYSSTCMKKCDRIAQNSVDL